MTDQQAALAKRYREILDIEIFHTDQTARELADKLARIAIEELVPKWLPMDSAPENGTPVDLWLRLFGDNEGHRNHDCHFEHGVGWQDAEGCAIKGIFIAAWLPLPAPPEKADG